MKTFILCVLTFHWAFLLGWFFNQNTRVLAYSAHIVWAVVGGLAYLIVSVLAWNYL